MGTTEHATGQAPRFAIVGYAARLPGAADADQYWEVLQAGRDAISEVPEGRWDADELFDPDPAAPGRVVTRRGGFVEDVTGFDAPFFGVSAREADWIDPQHRLLLETAWRAVEHSGIAPTALANSRTGVFVGLATHDYLTMVCKELDDSELEAYLAIGTSGAAGAGRISYRLGLQGPAVSVDTACSSSLVAIHQACQALRLGECDLALAGGANALLTPTTMITFSQSRMLAPDGKCKTFDAAADGYVRQDYAIALAERAGFKFVGSSEIDANPKDTANWPKGVWTLPPTFRLGDEDKAKYAAIGEADNFVLKFRQPAQ